MGGGRPRASTSGRADVHTLFRHSCAGRNRAPHSRAPIRHSCAGRNHRPPRRPAPPAKPTHLPHPHPNSSLPPERGEVRWGVGAPSNHHRLRRPRSPTPLPTRHSCALPVRHSCAGRNPPPTPPNRATIPPRRTKVRTMPTPQITHQLRTPGPTTHPDHAPNTPEHHSSGLRERGQHNVRRRVTFRNARRDLVLDPRGLASAGWTDDAVFQRGGRGVNVRGRRVVRHQIPACASRDSLSISSNHVLRSDSLASKVPAARSAAMCSS